ncbi:MAG: hypothetical protein AAFQ82_24135, partial [Myxococcota bacterium]
MPIFENDRPLLDGFRAGAAAALGRVYEFYLDDVVRLVRYGFVSGAARVQGIAERSAQLDLAHDVFMKAFRPDSQQKRPIESQPVVAGSSGGTKRL